MKYQYRKVKIDPVSQSRLIISVLCPLVSAVHLFMMQVLNADINHCLACLMHVHYKYSRNFSFLIDKTKLKRALTDIIKFCDDSV